MAGNLWEARSSTVVIWSHLPFITRNYKLKANKSKIHELKPDLLIAAHQPRQARSLRGSLANSRNIVAHLISAVTTLQATTVRTRQIFCQPGRRTREQSRPITHHQQAPTLARTRLIIRLRLGLALA